VAGFKTLSNHLWKHLDEWFVFLDRPDIEPTNWEGEQAIRPAVVNRKALIPITFSDVVPGPSISQVAQNWPNPHRLS
jgi:hypothetical protein